MPLFVCDICGCVDNTALGHYWGRDRDSFGKPELLGKMLCSECTPDTYKDGTKNPDGGKWHGKFPKRKATPEDLKADGFIDRNGKFIDGK